MQIEKILKDKCTNNRGITLIEIISVLVIIGILAVVAVSRYMSTADIDLIAKQEVLKSHIRYAQSRAMHSNIIWGIYFNGATYSLFGYDSSIPGLITPAPILPNVDSAAAPMPSGMSATGVVAFDFYGRPYYAVDNSGSLSSFTATPYDDSHKITGLTNITITPRTGFVP